MIKIGLFVDKRLSMWYIIYVSESEVERSCVGCYVNHIYDDLGVWCESSPSTNAKFCPTMDPMS